MEKNESSDDSKCPIKYDFDNPLESNEIQTEITEKFIISNTSRNILYILHVLLMIISSCDGGIVPQQHDEIKVDFNPDFPPGTDIAKLDETKYGLFSSIDYAGRVLGAIIFFKIINNYNRKYMFVGNIILKSLTLIIPMITINYIINVTMRALSGICQVFFTIYSPVWIDQYGKIKKRTIMLTLLQVGNPIGIILGYGIGMLCNKFNISFKGWRTGLLAEGTIMAIIGIIILFFDKNYFSQNLVLDDKNEVIGNIIVKEKDNENFCKELGTIICNKIFLFMTLSLCVSYSGLAIVQFYGVTYMDKVLNIDEDIRFLMFGGICAFGPVFGVIAGGLITSKIGGYINRKAMIFLLIIDIIIELLLCLLVNLISLQHLLYLHYYFYSE